jgi:hypothetical protein
MLDNNNHKNLNCSFAERTVAYLYGEINAQEKAVFETHLNSCAACAEEFAGFSAARSSVIEWRNEEFLSLETPSMEIPYANTREFYNSEIDSKVSHSWIDKFRRLFSLSPAFNVSASFAIVAICLGIIFFANKSSNNNDVTGISGKNIEQTISSPKINHESLQDTTSTNDLEKRTGETPSGVRPKSFVVVDKNNNRKTTSDSSAVRKISIVKVADVSRISAKNLNQEANSHKIKAAGFENKKQMFAQTGKIPRLNNVEEDEDKSLRLAELLEDDGAK